MVRSEPKWTAKFDASGASSMQVLKGSMRNDHIAIGTRQAVKTVAISDDNSELLPIRSMKCTTPTTCAAFHPVADSVIVAGGSNGEISVWYYGAQNIAPLNDKWVAHTRAINGMDFLPTRSDSSNYLVTASADGELCIWDMCSYVGKRETWRRTELVQNCRPEGFRSGLRDLDCRMCNGLYEIIVATDDGSVELYRSSFPSRDPSNISFRYKIQVSTQTINSVRFNPNDSSDLFATGGKDSYIRVYALLGNDKHRLVCSIRTSSSVWAIRWRPTGDFVAACQAVMDSCIYVWDLSSRLMPAYVFNSHRDNVTDFFWADNFHILSISRDNTAQLNQIQRAVIPIEKMRTVNISFGIDCRDGRETLASLGSVINRDKFEKDHAELDLRIIRKKGFNNKYLHAPSSLLSDEERLQTNRTLVMRPVVQAPGLSIGPGLLVRCVPDVTKFVSDLAKESTVAGAASLLQTLSKKFLDFSPSLSSQSELLRLTSWLLLHGNDRILEVTLASALETYRAMNDVLVVLILGAICIFSPLPGVQSLVTSGQMHAWSEAIIETLKRQRQWQLVAELIFFSPFSEVRSLSHAKTGITLVSRCCKRERDMGSLSCGKCAASLTLCSLCGDAVKGMWVSCPTCMHGGHARHMQRWFEGHSLCPVPDCDHECMRAYSVVS